MKTLNKFLLTSCAFLSLNTSIAFAEDEIEHSGDTFSFALIGDTPYKIAPGAVSVKFDRMQAEINQADDLLWTIHAGDFKSGSTKCSDALFYDRLERFNNFKMPFVFTPGDNEWTDCHRVKAGEYQPLERLAFLRELFFNQPGTTLGQDSMQVESQAFSAGFEEFPENVMWNRDDVIFSTVHVVGSQNGFKAFDPASSAVRSDADDKEVVRRINAAVAWVNKTFDQAESENAKGVFMVIQANPLLELKWLLKRDENGVVQRNGFSEFLQTIELRASAFAKPVVLAHGDSHYSRIDKPELPSAAKQGKDTYLSNFTRVETFGSSKVHWVKVSVSPDTDEVFAFKQMMVEGNQ